MNKELIKELFLQAGGPHLYAANRVHNDLLVRLIVEECVNVLKPQAEAWRETDEGLTARRHITAIKEHFGIEE